MNMILVKNYPPHLQAPTELQFSNPEIFRMQADPPVGVEIYTQPAYHALAQCQGKLWSPITSTQVREAAEEASRDTWLKGYGRQLLEADISAMLEFADLLDRIFKQAA
ncbi:MAG: hypothetical protein WCH98_17670 [Verrucomicrobiota bacterium]